jgi:Zn-finger nucleic acid-binding protein
MDCPRCNEPMTTRKIGEVEVDECLECKGIWFDRGELRQAKDEIDHDLSWMDFDIWKHKDEFHIAAKPTRCPRCGINMAGVNYGKTGVEICVCSKCRGSWLDGGEFDKIVTCLHEELETKTASDYVRESLEEAKEVFTGREGLASEWKDFATVLRMFEYRFFVEHPKLFEAVRDLSKRMPLS